MRKLIAELKTEDRLATEMKPLMISEEQNSVSLKRSIMNSTKIHESGECIYLFNQ